jgi:TolB-like protein
MPSKAAFSWGGNRMRVNVQLIDAETGSHLWAERFDKPLADLFDMQDEIVARLARAFSGLTDSRGIPFGLRS